MEYHLMAHSIQGQKYKRKGWECQDCSCCGELGNLQVIAVADGHGAADCFRSQIGSRLATQVVLEQATASFAANAAVGFNDTAIRNFKYALWSEWRKCVKEDWDSHTPAVTGGTDEIRFAAVAEDMKNNYLSSDVSVTEKYLYYAYGTTLIAAISDGCQILLLQVGDGTCAVLAQNGEFSTPIPPEEDNFLNKTFSLCDVNGDNADAKIRHLVLDYGNTEFNPVAIFLSTDGLDDCYPYINNSIQLFTNFYPLIIKYLLTEGYESTDKKIKREILRYMTDSASKDDISLAYLVTTDKDDLREAYTQIPEFLNKLRNAKDAVTVTEVEQQDG